MEDMLQLYRRRVEMLEDQSRRRRIATAVLIMLFAFQVGLGALLLVAKGPAVGPDWIVAFREAAELVFVSLSLLNLGLIPLGLIHIWWHDGSPR